MAQVTPYSMCYLRIRSNCPGTELYQKKHRHLWFPPAVMMLFFIFPQLFPQVICNELTLSAER